MSLDSPRRGDYFAVFLIVYEGSIGGFCSERE